MKYLAQIQAEFLKLSRSFEEMTMEQQQEYLNMHPRSKKSLRGQALNIARKLGLYYNGYQPEIHAFMFTEPETESSFYARNFEEAEHKIHEKCVLFGLKHASIIKHEYKYLATHC